MRRMFAAHGIELPEIEYDGTPGATKGAFLAFRGLYEVVRGFDGVKPMDVIESRDPETKRVHLTVVIDGHDGVTIDDVAGVYVLGLREALYGPSVKVLRYVGPGVDRIRD